MTRKDYVAIAGALRRPIEAFTTDCENHAAHCAWEETCRNVAAVMAADNPRFDRARFLRECGVQS